MGILLLSPQQSSEQRLGFLFFVSTIAIAGQKKKNLALKTAIVGKLNLGLFWDVFSGSPQLLYLNLRTDSMGRSLKKGVKSREDEKQEAPFPGCSPEKMSVFSGAGHWVAPSCGKWHKIPKHSSPQGSQTQAGKETILKG